MIAYFHGLESSAGGQKVKFLNDVYGDVYAPAMEYSKNNSLFDQVYTHLKNSRTELIIGSSMGGWFSYWLGKKLGVDTILFNPALPYRTSFEPYVDKSGNKRSFHHIVLGNQDTVIDPADTVKWLTENEKVSSYRIDYENYAHRTPLNSFIKYVKRYG